jgi:flagellar biosynthetic protein FliQ
MNVDLISDIVSNAVWLLLTICLVAIIPSLLIGLCVSIFQAATQINEQTLSFLPRLVMTFIVLIFAGRWMLLKLSDFTIHMFTQAAELIR